MYCSSIACHDAWDTTYRVLIPCRVLSSLVLEVLNQGVTPSNTLLISHPLSFVYRSPIYAELVSLRCSCLLRCCFFCGTTIFSCLTCKKTIPPSVSTRLTVCRSGVGAQEISELRTLRFRSADVAVEITCILSSLGHSARRIVHDVVDQEDKSENNHRYQCSCYRQGTITDERSGDG